MTQIAPRRTNASPCGHIGHQIRHRHVPGDEVAENPPADGLKMAEGKIRLFPPIGKPVPQNAECEEAFILSRLQWAWLFENGHTLPYKNLSREPFARDKHKRIFHNGAAAWCASQGKEGVKDKEGYIFKTDAFYPKFIEPALMQENVVKVVWSQNLAASQAIPAQRQLVDGLPIDSDETKFHRIDAHERWGHGMQGLGHEKIPLMNGEFREAYKTYVTVPQIKEYLEELYTVQPLLKLVYGVDPITRSPLPHINSMQYGCPETHLPCQG